MTRSLLPGRKLGAAVHYYALDWARAAGERPDVLLAGSDGVADDLVRSVDTNLWDVLVDAGLGPTEWTVTSHRRLKNS